MRLMLTSAGITNSSIAGALIGLVGKPRSKISVAFIPTAANLLTGDKTWLVENLEQLKRQSYASIDIVDITAMPQEVWQPRLEAADLICVGGGDEQYLAKVMWDTGLSKILPRLLQTRAYMGISAGSMVMGHFLPDKLVKIVYPEEVCEELALPLRYVDLLFLPHLNSSYYTHVRKKVLTRLQGKFSHPLYACDDDSALKVVGGKIDVIGEGHTLVFNKRGAT